MEYIKNFHQSRAHKIGASEISACIPHPERAGSVAGYEQTALTIWEEKTGRRERDAAGFAAEMGHVLEPYILRKCIEDNFGKEESENFYRGYLLNELDKNHPAHMPQSFQYGLFLHHTRAENDYAIAHADCINVLDGVIIEAKSASFWSARRGDDPYNGYDLDLKGHQGIPLKNYFQMQFQCAMYQAVYGAKIDRLILALLFDTNHYQSWEFLPDAGVMSRLLEIASYMKICIDNDTPPRTLAMNQADIKIMYPSIEEDFRIISGGEMETAIELARAERHAADQEKMWSRKKTDAADALSILLKDTKTIKAVIDGEITDIATWQERAGSERIIPLSEKKKDEEVYKYLSEKNLIKQGEPSWFVKVRLK